MSRILESFKEWKSSLNEQGTPSRVKLTNDINQKAVITPIDKTSFRVRAKWVNDMIDATGKLTPSGFNSILTEIRDYIDPSTGQASLINYYSGLKDLTRNLVVYDVIRDTDTAKDPNPKIRKQTFKFTVVSRELYPNVPANTLYVHQDDANTPSTKTGQTVNTGEVLTAGDTFGFDFSRGPVYITNPSDAKMIQLIDSFYFKLSADDVLVAMKGVNEFRKAVAAELKAARLGDNAKTLISALNAAFGIVTRYGDIETGVTQPLLQKLKEVKSTAPGAKATGVILSQSAGFNLDAFIAGLKSTSGIAVPSAGFIKGQVTKDPEFKKFQQLLIAKFQKSLGSTRIYKNFARFKTGGADGTYGPNTAALVGLLKAALSDPKWLGNGDKNQVDQAFVDRINQEKVAESFIALDGLSILVEGLDMSIVNSYEPRRNSQAAPSSKSTKKKEVDLKAKDAKKPVSTLTLDATAAKNLDKLFISLAESVKSYFENDSNFSAYSGEDDDEQGAWDNIAMKRINRVFMPELNKIKKELDRYSKDPLDLKGDYKKTIWTFENKVFFNGDIKGKETRLKWKFMNYSEYAFSTTGDDLPFNFKLFLYDGVKSYTIKTDF
jgi:hypothetical protein